MGCLQVSGSQNEGPQAFSPERFALERYVEDAGAWEELVVFDAAEGADWPDGSKAYPVPLLASNCQVGDAVALEYPRPGPQGTLAALFPNGTARVTLRNTLGGAADEDEESKDQVLAPVAGRLKSLAGSPCGRCEAGAEDGDVDVEGEPHAAPAAGAWKLGDFENSHFSSTWGS